MGTNVKLTQLFSIGGVDGPDEYAFGAIDALTVDRSGRFYAYDSHDTQIRQYDAAGKFLRNVGRPGSGPGEYKALGSMTVARDSLLVILDMAHVRLSYFGPDGKFVNSFQDPAAVFGNSDYLTFDTNGLIYFKIRGNGAGEVGARIGVKPTKGHRVLRLRENGARVDTLILPVPLIRQRA